MIGNKTKSFFSNIPIDKPIFYIALSLSIIGILFIYSSQYPKIEGGIYLKQIASLFIALTVYFIFSKIDYHLYSGHPIVLYVFGFILLAVVVIFGKTVNGSTSWVNFGFFHAQLSEFVKLAYIIAFSGFIVRYQDNLPSISFFFIAGCILMPYIGLILLQPDIGTAIIFIFIFVIMFFVSGGNSFVLILLPPIAILSIVLPFLGYLSEYVHPNFLSYALWDIRGYVLNILIFSALLTGAFLLYRLFARKFLFITMMVMFILVSGFMGGLMLKYILKPYHYERIAVVFDPSIDPMGKGYNINQSFISIGSGGLFGQGYLKGSQNRGNFLPAENTDFIVALVGEEWGFAGTILLIILNIFLIYTLLQRANDARDFLGFLITVGVAALLSTHFVINIFSAIGFLPVIGIPLPFVSYGGSSLLTNFAALGIIYNINNSRFSFNS